MSHTEFGHLLYFKTSFHMSHHWKADSEDLQKKSLRVFSKLQVRDQSEELGISIDTLKKQKTVFAYCVLFSSCIMALLL